MYFALPPPFALFLAFIVSTFKHGYRAESITTDLILLPCKELMVIPEMTKDLAVFYPPHPLSFYLTAPTAVAATTHFSVYLLVLVIVTLLSASLAHIYYKSKYIAKGSETPLSAGNAGPSRPTHRSDANGQ